MCKEQTKWKVGSPESWLSRVHKSGPCSTCTSYQWASNYPFTSVYFYVAKFHSVANSATQVISKIWNQWDTAWWQTITWRQTWHLPCKSKFTLNYIQVMYVVRFWQPLCWSLWEARLSLKFFFFFFIQSVSLWNNLFCLHPMLNLFFLKM